jgi:hypothetical protein
VAVNRAGRQIHHLDAGRGHLHCALAIGEAHKRIGSGDIKIVADERHAEWGIQPVQEDGARVYNAIAINVAEQGDAVGAGHGRPRPFHDQLHNPASEAFAILGPGRGIGLGDEDVAIGEDIEPAGVIKAGRISAHRQARCHHRSRTAKPALGRGDVDGGKQGGIWCRERRLGAEPGTFWQGGLFSTAGETQE